MGLAHLVEWFAANPWVVATSFLLGVLGVMVPVLLYYKSVRVRQPKWVAQSSNLVRGFQGKIDQLEILFAGRKIANLTVTRVVLWNDGKETVRREDIAATDPVVIQTKGDARLLDCRLLAANSPTINASLAMPDDTHLTVEFDYLDHRQGLVIQVLHTGLGSEDVEVLGTVKGGGPFAPQPQLVNPLDDSTRVTLFGRKIAVTGPIMFVFMGFCLVSIVVYNWKGHAAPVGLSIISLVIMVVLARYLLDGVMRSTLPRGLGRIDSNGWWADREVKGKP